MCISIYHDQPTFRYKNLTLNIHITTDTALQRHTWLTFICIKYKKYDLLNMTADLFDC